MGVTYKGIGHLQFSCKSIEDTLKFYIDKLGFRKKFELSGTADDGFNWHIDYLEVAHGQLLELLDLDYGDNLASGRSFNGYTLGVPADKYEALAIKECDSIIYDPDGNEITIARADRMHISHITLKCNDYANMKDFYGNKLGFQKYREREEETVYEIANGEYLRLIPRSYEVDSASSFSHLCFEVEDILSVARLMDEQGLMMRDEDYRYLNDDPSETAKEIKKVAMCGSLSAVTHDPEGNMVEFMQYTDQSLQLMENQI